MKICVYGAGAVGGHIAGRLAAGQTEVSVIERGEQLDAIREHGLRVETRERTLVSHPFVTDQPGDLQPQDIVIVAVKAPILPKHRRGRGLPATPGQPGALRRERHPVVVLPRPRRSARRDPAATAGS